MEIRPGRCGSPGVRGLWSKLHEPESRQAQVQVIRQRICGCPHCFLLSSEYLVERSVRCSSLILATPAETRRHGPETLNHREMQVKARQCVACARASALVQKAATLPHQLSQQQTLSV